MFMTSALGDAKFVFLNEKTERERKREMDRVRVTTPAGIARFPYLTTPDTKWSEEGVFCVTLRLYGEEGEGLFNDLKARLEAHTEVLTKQLGKPPARINAIPCKQDLDDDGKKFFDFKFKMKPVIRMKSGESIEQRPQLFDAQVNPLLDQLVGGGSKIKVSFIPFAYSSPMGAGITLRLVAVQVLDLVPPTANQESNGFAVEEGFSVSTEGPTSSSSRVALEEDPSDTLSASQF